MFLVELGSSFAEVLTSIPVLAGLLLLLDEYSKDDWDGRRFAAAGLLLGFATGLKLGNGLFAVGAVRAVDGVSFSIRKGGRLGIVGESGCGKSTLIRCLNRMNDLINGLRTEGSIKIDGIEVLDPELDVIAHRYRVGMVFQKSNPFPKSIYENVIFGLRIAGIKDKSVLDEAVEQSLKRAAIWEEVKERLHKSAMGLSGGQMQRLCIARAIAVNPEIILMDEPCSALDPRATAAIEDLIRELRSEYPIIIVPHNMQQAARVSDYTAYMYLGKLVEYDLTGKIFTAPSHRETEDYISGRFG